jgi:hypothetical protein
MKKLIILAVLLSLFFSVNAQVNGVDFSNSVNIKRAIKLENEKLYKVNDNGYGFFYSNNAVGYKHSYEKINELLRSNNLYFDEPTIDQSFLPGYIDSYTEYNDVQTACYIGSGEISMAWLTKSGFILGWKVNEEVIMILIAKRKH